MSDNEDLLGDDLGDHSLADYNLGNEEEEQLLADDYDMGASQNVPTSVGSYRDNVDLGSTEYPSRNMGYNQSMQYHSSVAESECIVPNISVEVPNTPLPEHSTYAPYEPPVYEADHAVVPPAIPAAPIESPQIVPSEMSAPIANGEIRERFVSERPPGAQRMPQVRNIPDSLDKVYVPRGSFNPRGRNSWRNPQFRHNNHPYRRNNMHRGNFAPRPSFPPPQMRVNQPQIRPEIFTEVRPEIHPEIRPPVPQIRPEIHEIRPEVRPEIHTEIRPEIRPKLRPEMRPEMHPEMRPEMHPEMRPDMRPEMQIHPEMRPEMRPDMRPEMRPDIRPEMRPDMRPELRQEMQMRPEIRPDIRPDMRPEMRPDMRPEMHPEIRPEIHEIRPEMHPIARPMPPLRQDIRPDLPPGVGPELSQLPPQISPERPMPDMMPFRVENRPPFPRFPFRPNIEERPFMPRPYEPRLVFFQPPFNPRFGPPAREIANNNVPQVTIRQEPEVRMLPVLPPILPPGGLAGKKVLINPHFKGNFQPPVDGLPTYIPTRIHKSPPPSPTMDLKFVGPIKDIDDAAERFIAEQRNALARAANRKFARRSPQRYIENTTIEIENELARAPPRRSDDEELLRKQEEFINANRAGLRRRMRSPSPVRRSPSPRRSPERRPERRPPPPDEDTEYRRRLREQESLRERVLRAKEVRRRKNAVLLHNQILERERERDEREQQTKLEEAKPEPMREASREDTKPSSTLPEVPRPNTTRKSPEKPPRREVERERSPQREEAEVNSTCEPLTPPRPPRALTPPLPAPPTAAAPPPHAPPPAAPPRRDSDDELDLILDDIDGILSDDDDSGRFKERNKPVETPKPQVDLRSKLPPKAAEVKRPPRQKITFNDAKEREREKEKEDKKKKEKSPIRRTIVTSSNKTTKTETTDRKPEVKQVLNDSGAVKSRQRIMFDSKQVTKEKDKKPDADKAQPFSNRRVILQRKTAEVKKSVFTRVEKNDPSKPNPGIFSRAVRTAISSENNRIVIKKQEPKVEYESESDYDEDKLLEDIGTVACVENLPHGMTDTRLKTLAGNDVQSLELDKEERKAKITFKTTNAAEVFKKKFNNKMVAASRLSVTLC